jgi:hypothetical protein
LQKALYIHKKYGKESKRFYVNPDEYNADHLHAKIIDYKQSKDILSLRWG